MIDERLDQKHVWIGFSDISVEDSWYWVDGVKTSENTPWGEDEPNDFSGNEDCALFRIDGTLNDFPCTREFQGLCEIKQCSNLFLN